MTVNATGCGFDPYSSELNIYLHLYFHFFALVSRQTTCGVDFRHSARKTFTTPRKVKNGGDKGKLLLQGSLWLSSYLYIFLYLKATPDFLKYKSLFILQPISELINYFANKSLSTAWRCCVLILENSKFNISPRDWDLNLHSLYLIKYLPTT